MPHHWPRFDAPTRASKFARDQPFSSPIIEMATVMTQTTVAGMRAKAEMWGGEMARPGGREIQAAIDAIIRNRNPSPRLM